MNDQIQSQNTQ